MSSPPNTHPHNNEGLSLPVDAVRKDFDEAARRQDRPIIVVAPTGSGKSTRLPGWMLETTKAPVLIVEPRRVACRSLAEFVAKQRGGDVGGEVGYRVRFEDRSSPSTRMLFVTPGVALRMMARPTAPFADASVLIDEFHERGWEVDLAVAKRLGDASSGLTVLTSATLDTETLARRVGADVIHAEGRSFPIAIEHQDGPRAPSRRDLEFRVRDAVVNAVAAHPGDILVFLPGRAEINASERAVNAAGLRGVDVVTMHGRMNPAQMSRALSSRVDAPRRVILATNVAETSLTLPRVRVVIDSGLMRATVHRGGRSALALVAAPQSSLDQRAGRAGRVAPGVCIRLFSRGFSADAHATPEIERMELDDVMLQAAALGLEGDGFEAARWPTPPPAFAIDRARKRLVAAGALAPDGARTKRGEAWSEMPVSASVAALLHDARGAVLGATLADVVAVTERDGSLFLPGAASEAVSVARAELLNGVNNEVEANVWALRRGDAARDGLHPTRLKEARLLAKRLRGMVNADFVDPTKDKPRPRLDDDVAVEIAKRRPRAAFIQRPRASKPSRSPNKGAPWGNGEDELLVSEWSVRSLGVDLDVDDGPGTKVEAGVVLSSRWVAKEEGLGVRGFGEMLIPCRLSRLAETDVGETVVEAARLLKRPKKAGAIKIVASVRQVLADVVIAERESEIRGAPLRTAAAEFIAAGRLFAPVGEATETALQVWRVCAALKETPVAIAAETTVSMWIASKLETLGLETCEDFGLIDAADLATDLWADAQIAPDVERRAATDFPPTWSYQGATYFVVVDAARKTVRLVAEGKAAKKAVDPPAAVVPRFRGMNVELQRASRVKRLRP